MSIGPWQIILILVIVLIIFGAGKLPRVAGDLAAGIKNFKKGMSEEDKAEAAEKSDKKPEVLQSSAKDEAEKKDKAAQG
ncbi:MAG: twin-arginine translocase TatA/TatE family subunit [Sneathiella sp.]|nr:twin-arginine translocase TatA/TatE family subunit [Sneathiella sp.]